MERENTTPGVMTADSPCSLCRNLDFEALTDDGLYLNAQFLKSTYETNRCNTCLMLLNAAMRFPILDGFHAQVYYGCFILHDTDSDFGLWDACQRLELYTLGILHFIFVELFPDLVI
jgi:hypothetical protein